MKTKFISFLIFNFTFLILNLAFTQKPLKPMKPQPRGLIQKPIEKVQTQKHIRPERMMKMDARNECDEGYVEDCSGDGDCCPESWIGDSYEDCEDQQWGCDLMCYNCDGMDCCTPLECGDGICDAYENSESCPEDCEDSSSEACEDCLYDYTSYGAECCDAAYYEYGLDCFTLEANYYWDCEGCDCPVEEGCEWGGVVLMSRW